VHTTVPSADADLIGAEIVFGATSLGHVLGVVRDPHSQRVRQLITAYGPHQRRVAVPLEWVTRRTPTRLTLAVGAGSLDDLADQRELGPLHTRIGAAYGNGTNDTVLFPKYAATEVKLEGED
jgi:hypothetical protein